MYCKDSDKLVTCLVDMKGTEDDCHTFSVLQSIANSITPMLHWTFDVPSKHPDKCVPCLDIKISKHREDQANQIKFQFFQKAVARKTLVTEDSALSAASKFSILVAEGCRRIKNTILVYLKIKSQKFYKNTIIG